MIVSVSDSLLTDAKNAIMLNTAREEVSKWGYSRIWRHFIHHACNRVGLDLVVQTYLAALPPLPNR